MATYLDMLRGRAVDAQRKAALTAVMARNARANGRVLLARIHQNKAWAYQLEATLHRQAWLDALDAARRQAVGV